jgi:hypothetical protein
MRLEILSVVGSRLSAEYGQYRFVQSVVRQVAYGTQSRRDRKARHVAVAQYFESSDDAGGTGFAPIVAQHYLDAIAASADTDSDVPALRASAVEHLVRAAAHARSVGAPGEARRYLETALDHVVDDDAAALHLDAAWAAHEAGDLAGVLEHTDAATAGFLATGDAIGAGGAAAFEPRASSGSAATWPPRWTSRCLIGRRCTWLPVPSRSSCTSPGRSAPPGSDSARTLLT